jgi:hypothetical protein
MQIECAQHHNARGSPAIYVEKATFCRGFRPIPGKSSYTRRDRSAKGRPALVAPHRTDNAVFHAALTALPCPGTLSISSGQPWLAPSFIPNSKMSQAPVSSAFTQFVTATASRNMTKAAYLAVAIGVAAMVALSVSPTFYWADALLWACLAFFAFEWVVRLRHSAKTGRPYLFTGRGLLDSAGVIAVPIAFLAGAEARTAWLLAVLWFVKVIPGIPGLRQLRRVMFLEYGALLSVLVLFLMVLFLGSVAEYFLERDAQPQTFGNVPAALWWAVVTLTTTGYGDVFPLHPIARSLCNLEAVIGQLYPATLLARLVTLEMTHRG